MTILRYQFTHINVVWHNDCFWTTFVLKRASATIEFIKPVLNGASSPHKGLSLLINPCGNNHVESCDKYLYENAYELIPFFCRGNF